MSDGERGGSRGAGNEKGTREETVRCVRAMRRARAFEALCKKEGIKQRPLVLKNANAKISPQMMKWRRISSITLRLEPFMDDRERREGLGRLMGWLEKAFTGNGEGKIYRGDAEARRTENGEDRTENLEENGEVQTARTGDGVDNGECAIERVSSGDRSVPATQKERMICADWNGTISSWERVKRDGFSVEAICANLGISRWKLTQLTKEFCNLTVNEVIDGFKLKQLKPFLIERLRAGARALWGTPGYYAAFKANGYVNCESAPLSDSSLLREKTKQSRYFRMTPQELFNEDKHTERERRMGELIERMWRGLDFESWAISAGFSSAARLKRAVLTVLGKSIKELERVLAAEVVEFYLCAEDRELRNLALKDGNFPGIFRARESYHGNEDKPVEPFLDRWSAALFGAKEWVERMVREFG